MELTIRGQVLTIDFVADTQILPLAKVLGAAGLKEAPDETSPHYDRWKNETTNAFMQPENQAVVAYTLCSLFPALDPAIARYRIKRYDEGYSEIDFNLAINIDELLSVIEVLSPYLEKRAKTLKAQNEKQPPKGFAPQSRTKQVERDPEEAERRIKELEEQLALKA